MHLDWPFLFSCPQLPTDSMAIYKKATRYRYQTPQSHYPWRRTAPPSNKRLSASKILLALLCIPLGLGDSWESGTQTQLAGTNVFHAQGALLTLFSFFAGISVASDVLLNVWGQTETLFQQEGCLSYTEVSLGWFLALLSQPPYAYVNYRDNYQTDITSNPSSLYQIIPVIAGCIATTLLSFTSFTLEEGTNHILKTIAGRFLNRLKKTPHSAKSRLLMGLKTTEAFFQNMPQQTLKRLLNEYHDLYADQHRQQLQALAEETARLITSETIQLSFQEICFTKNQSLMLREKNLLQLEEQLLLEAKKTQHPRINQIAQKIRDLADSLYWDLLHYCLPHLVKTSEAQLSFYHDQLVADLNQLKNQLNTLELQHAIHFLDPLQIKISQCLAKNSLEALHFFLEKSYKTARSLKTSLNKHANIKDTAESLLNKTVTTAELNNILNTAIDIFKGYTCIYGNYLSQEKSLLKMVGGTVSGLLAVYSFSIAFIWPLSVEATQEFFNAVALPENFLSYFIPLACTLLNAWLVFYACYHVFEELYDRYFHFKHQSLIEKYSPRLSRTLQYCIIAIVLSGSWNNAWLAYSNIDLLLKTTLPTFIKLQHFVLGYLITAFLNHTAIHELANVVYCFIQIKGFEWIPRHWQNDKNKIKKSLSQYFWHQAEKSTLSHLNTSLMTHCRQQIAAINYSKYLTPEKSLSPCPLSINA